MASPDPDKFLKNERPNEYEARFTVTGEILLTIKADSLEDAQAKARSKLEDDDFGSELDDVGDVRVNHVWKSVPMFLVLRDGKVMQVSRLAEGDLPREPTERGF